MLPFSCGLFTWVWSAHTRSGWYCIGLMSTPICHCCSPCCTGAVDTFCHQLSTCAGLHNVLPSLHASTCHTDKASLSSCTETTMLYLRGTLALVRRPRVPAERLPWVCLSLKSSLISCQEDKRKVKLALFPHTTYCSYCSLRCVFHGSPLLVCRCF